MTKKDADDFAANGDDLFHHREQSIAERNTRGLHRSHELLYSKFVPLLNDRCRRSDTVGCLHCSDVLFVCFTVSLCNDGHNRLFAFFAENILGETHELGVLATLHHIGENAKLINHVLYTKERSFFVKEDRLFVLLNVLLRF